MIERARCYFTSGFAAARLHASRPTARRFYCLRRKILAFFLCRSATVCRIPASKPDNTAPHFATELLLYRFPRARPRRRCRRRRAIDLAGPIRYQIYGPPLDSQYAHWPRARTLPVALLANIFDISTAGRMRMMLIRR
jgi:hypothetical protein